MNTTGPEMAYREYEDRFAALKQQNAALTAEVERLKRDLCMTEAERDAARDLVAEAVALLKTHGNHRMNCSAFPATSEEQIARDCDCGLSSFLARIGGG